MNDIFGRLFTIFLAAAVLFGMPLVYMNERAKTAEQLYLLTEATHFVDSVCNTGFVNGEMLRSLYASLSTGSAVYEITFLHEQPEYVYDEEQGRYVRCETFYDEDTIWEQVERGVDYLFGRGDFFRITVRKKAGFLLFSGIADRTVGVQYGGTVKYEAY